jgi:hypothetical protein
MSSAPSANRYARHPDMAWTSFDRFGRYSAMVELLARTVGDELAYVVDVGDRSGYLRRFLPDTPSIAFDLGVEPAAFPDLVFGLADGRHLPIADGAVPAVVTCDVLEHVPPDGRDALIGELTRVADRAVLLTAPFATFGVAGVESVVARYAWAVNGERQPQLAEHEDLGLPDLAATTTSLTSRGWDVRVVGEGNLLDWLGVMLLRFGAETRNELQPVGDGIDVVYNHLLSARSDVGPYYRHILVATPAVGDEGAATGLAEALAVDALSVDATGSAFLGQLGLLDLVPRLNVVDRELGSITSRLEHTAASVDRVLGQQVDLTHRIDDLAEHLRRLEALTADVGERTFHSTIRRALRKLRRR